MNPRRYIPQEFWPIIEKVLTGKMGGLKFERDSRTKTVSIVETAKDSPFHFKFINFGLYEEGTISETAIYPIDDDLSKSIEDIGVANLESFLQNWVDIVSKFSAPSPLFDKDPILNQYMKEQEGFFEVLDEDAQRASFSFEKQKALHNVYDLIIQEVLKEEDQTPKVQAYVKELKESQAEIGADTKQEAVSRFSRNIAKARKVGVSIFEKIIVKLTAEGAISLWPKVAGLAQALLT
jgi:hypothetical protein